MILCTSAVLAASAVATRDLQEAAGQTRSVELFVSALGPNGRSVSGLTQDDFELHVDGRPQAVTSFESGPRPLNVVVLLDTSGSMSPLIEVAERAADEFLKRLRPADAALVGGFHKTVIFQPDSGFTTSVDALREGMTRLTVGYPTALYDAIDQSIERLKSRKGRKVVIVLTDGDDTASKRTARDAMDRARDADVTVYAIGVHNEYFNGQTRVRTTPDRGLKNLAASSGGVLSMQQSVADTGLAFALVAEELHHQYVMAFSAPVDGKVHKVEVKTRRTDLTVRTRQTYR